jgi:hypothetical protein
MKLGDDKIISSFQSNNLKWWILFLSTDNQSMPKIVTIFLLESWSRKLTPAHLQGDSRGKQGKKKKKKTSTFLS